MGIKDLLGQTYCLLRLSRTLSKLNAFIEGARSLQNEEWPMAGPLVCLDGGFYLPGLSLLLLFCKSGVLVGPYKKSEEISFFHEERVLDTLESKTLLY